MSRTRKLDPTEIRVLGALLEKEQTTPDQYPMTINTVIAACNQKTNREPVMSLSETEVVEALDRLREDVLTWRSMGARAERWQHSLDRRWGLDKKKKAVMTLLLLRGPQTPGELRTRSERLCGFDSVDDVENTLSDLANGFDALVRELPRRPGQREIRWVHLEGAEEDPRASAAEPAAAAPAPPSRDTSGEAPIPQRRMASPYDERLETLEEAVSELRATMSSMQEQLQAMRKDLGYDE